MLIEASVNHQKLKESVDYFKILAKHLDDFFNVKWFTADLEKKSTFYKNRLTFEDESLFIHESHIPFLVQSEVLCTEYDKLWAFIILQGWIKDFQIPNELIYKKIGVSFNFSKRTTNLINGFIIDSISGDLLTDYFKIKPEEPSELEKLEGKWVEENEPQNIKANDYVIADNVKNSVDAIYLGDFNVFVIKCGCEPAKPIKKNNQLCPDKYCILQSGDSVSIGNDLNLTFTNFKKKYISNKFSNFFCLTALNAEWNYLQKNGVRSFNFIGQPGELIGIIGSEGTGKSTLLALLGGFIKPQTGSVYVNGYNLQKNFYQLSGFIGYVPEEDLLFDELTVRDNLNICARLYLNHNSLATIDVLVDNLLKELELWDIKNEIVGAPKDKIIQPGQRRLLNIALELIRDPQILIIDNAISSLSMSDSSKVVEVLSKYTFKGKLIITSITQTNQKTFELFDKLFVLDKGGIPVYFGSRYAAISFFNSYLPEGIASYYTPDTAISPEIIFNILSVKHPLAKSKFDSQRYIDSDILYKKQANLNYSTINESRNRKKISGKLSHSPRLERQYLIFSFRNFKVKLAQKKELYFALLSVPILSAFIALLLKSPKGESYSFDQNSNIPVFFFISSIILFFIGISMSVKEIISERHLLKKEEYLNLSIFSYINAKITFLILIISLQAFAYTFIANSILEISGMLLRQWLIYFSIAMSGALLGLIFSILHSKLESVLLKTAPITLVILILLGGGWIPYRSLFSQNKKYTPIITDYMVSRLAYESLVVDQFLSNSYQKNFIEAEKLISNGSYNSYHILPKINAILEDSQQILETKSDSLITSLYTLKKYFDDLSIAEDIYPFEFIKEIDNKEINEEILTEAIDYVSYLDYYFYNSYNAGLKKKQAITDSLIKVLGKEEFEMLKNKNQNAAIVQLVRNSNTRESLILSNNEFVRLSDPVFQRPANNFGRAPLYSAQKRFNDQVIDTFVYNLSIIWLINFAFYILLISGLFNRLVYKFNS